MLPIHAIKRKQEWKPRSTFRRV
jgi:hypothetical protein